MKPQTRTKERHKDTQTKVTTHTDAKIKSHKGGNS